ncbi:MAG: TetM/TetW/TetO/TetS family tetracycline resistance ribosomal protection protein [Spirochaetes bacterium]|nr:TetM/TetW/TetO/TetS family tetracycline resistance ribosomal protection protein [Spirochaetota bacterium]
MKAKSIKNIGIIAHIDAGKTTLSERFLYYSGKIHKIGSVDEGTTELDYLEEEKERGITIISAATSFQWKDSIINLIDTPGHIDFIEEVRKSLFVVDCCILVICGTSHVQAQTETLYNLCKKLNIPLIVFINKMDRNTSNFTKSFESLLNKFNKYFIPITIPLYTKDDKFIGVYNILDNNAYIYNINLEGDRYNVINNFLTFDNNKVLQNVKDFIFKDDINFFLQYFIDTLSSKSEKILNHFLNQPDNYSIIGQNYEAIVDEIYKLCINRELFPVFCGSAYKNIAIHSLLDGIVLFAPEYNILKPKVLDINKNTFIEIPQNISLGYIFKIIYDKQAGKIFFARIYNGHFEKNQKIYIPDIKEFDRLPHLYKVHANKKNEIDRCEEGDIICIIGSKYLNLFYTFSSDRKDIIFNKKDFIDPVISMRIEPLSIKDFYPLIDILKIIENEDPSFKFKLDESTATIIISGMGELHLEIIQHRIENEFKIKTKVGTPLINYRESISKTNSISFNLKKEIKGVLLKCEVEIEVSPNNSNSYSIDDKNLTQNYYPFIDSIIQSIFLSGIKFGYPLFGVKITIKKVSIDNKENSEIILQETINKALINILEQSGPVLLEPYMKIEVVCPYEHFSEVYNDLLKRSNNIISLEDIIEETNYKVIKAMGYLKNFFGYSTILRSLTSGKGTFSMEFNSYEKSQ